MKILSAKEAIEVTIQAELKDLIETPKAPYIKFILVATSIEFLGACMDQNAWTDNKKSPDRFKSSILKLFPRTYHQYAKKDSPINLYRDFRCEMVHKLSQSRNIRLTERRHQKGGEKLHLAEMDGQLILVLEDLYEDLFTACEKIKRLYKKGKLPNKKLDEDYIYIQEK